MDQIKKVLILPEKKLWISEVSRQKIVRHIFPNPSTRIKISYFSPLATRNRTMGIRKDSNLYVYEMPWSLEDCRTLYARRTPYRAREKVDVFDPQAKRWRAGVVAASRWKTGSGKLAVVNEVVLESQDPSETLQVDNENIAPHMSHVGTSIADVINLPVYNRYFKPDGTVASLEFPKMISFGTWCTCSQIVAEALLQARSFLGRYGTSMI